MYWWNNEKPHTVVRSIAFTELRNLLESILRVVMMRNRLHLQHLTLCYFSHNESQGKDGQKKVLWDVLCLDFITLHLDIAVEFQRHKAWFCCLCPTTNGYLNNYVQVDEKRTGCLFFFSLEAIHSRSLPSFNIRNVKSWRIDFLFVKAVKECYALADRNTIWDSKWADL